MSPASPSSRQPPRKFVQRPKHVLLAMEFYIHAIHEGVVRFARQAGWVLDASMVQMRNVPSDWEGDGIIALANTTEMSNTLKRYGSPMVGVVVPPKGAPCPSVVMDDAVCGRLAAEHLIGRGFRRLAFYQPSNSPVVNTRKQGYCQTLHAAKLEFFELDWSKKGHFLQNQDRKRWLIAQLQRLPKPIGVFASGDLFATEVLSACRIAGIGVPEEVAVVGVDNDPLYVEVAPVPISSVDNNLERVGYEAAGVLERVMQGQKVSMKPVVIPPVGVVSRRSTDILAVDDVCVGRALAFIYQHFASQVRVRDVAQHSGTSLRRLQSRFKHELGLTIVQYINQLRMEQAKKLLSYTTGNIQQVATQSGFTDGKYFGKLFTRAFGQSPRQYRRRMQEERLATSPTSHA